MSPRLVDRGARFFRDPRTGRLVIAQWPNWPLAVWIVATSVLRLVDPGGAARTTLSAVATTALAWWALSEIRTGLSPFRRVLGALVLLGLAVRLVLG